MGQVVTGSSLRGRRHCDAPATGKPDNLNPSGTVTVTTMCGPGPAVTLQFLCFELEIQRLHEAAA